MNNKRNSSPTLLWMIIGSLLYSAASLASGDEWPISFTTITINPADYEGEVQSGPLYDCQPDLFDPIKSWFRKVEPEGLVGIDSSSADIYEVKGEDESVTMNIDSWSRQNDAKTVLPEPYSVTKYNFACASNSSQVLEFRKNGKRYALYTHISHSMFSPDRRTFVLFNHVMKSKGIWQETRRIIDLETKKFSLLPLNETSYIADITNDKVVTYGGPTVSTAGIDARRRIVGIWNLDGKLIRALSAPIQTTTANALSSDDGIGLLPDEPTTFYHLTRTGENVATMWLQDILHAEGRRSIRLAVPGTANEPASVGMSVQIDLRGLRLKSGTMKYRVSLKGRGDVTGDWEPWQIAE